MSPQADQVGPASYLPNHLCVADTEPCGTAMGQLPAHGDCMTVDIGRTKNMGRRRKKTRVREAEWGTWRYSNEAVNPVTGVGRQLPDGAVIAVNDRYQVTRTELGGGWVHLSIKRHDRRPVRDWRAFQRIKNELAGAEREAVELYPAERRLHDAANQYHLWVAPPGVEWPVGFEGRSVSSTAYRYPGAVQRALPPGTPETPTRHEVTVRRPERGPQARPTSPDDPQRP